MANQNMQSWRDSLRIPWSHLEELRSCEQGPSWFNQVLSAICRKRSAWSGDNEDLDILNPKLLEKEGKSNLQRFLYRFEPGKNMSSNTNIGVQDTTGVLFYSPHAPSSPETMAVLLSQSMGEDSEKTHHAEDEVTNHFVGYRYGTNQYIPIHIGHHALAWERESDPLNRWPSPAFDRQAFLAHGKPICINFNFRYMSLTAEPKSASSITMCPNLQKGRIIKLDPSTHTSLYERRHMLMMRIFPANQNSYFTMMSLGGLQFDGTAMVAKPEVAGSLTPFMLFIKHLRRLLIAYYAEWYAILAHIAREVDFSVDDVSNLNSIEKFMFAKDDLHVSKVWVATFQMLRLCENMIEETHNDFLDWSSKLLATFKQGRGGKKQLGERSDALKQEIKDMTREWHKWEGGLKNKFGQLRGRFKEKRQDFTSLTGILNDSTAIREAIRGTEEARRSTEEARKSNMLNRYVLTFTVVTIVYLPLTFVTAIFSMNNIPDGSPFYASAKPFGWMLVALSLTTYLIAGASLFFFKEREKKKSRGHSDTDRKDQS